MIPPTLEPEMPPDCTTGPGSPAREECGQVGAREFRSQAISRAGGGGACVANALGMEEA